MQGWGIVGVFDPVNARRPAQCGLDKFKETPNEESKRKRQLGMTNSRE